MVMGPGCAISCSIELQSRCVGSLHRLARSHECRVPRRRAYDTRPAFIFQNRSLDNGARRGPAARFPHLGPTSAQRHCQHHLELCCWSRLSDRSQRQRDSLVSPLELDSSHHRHDNLSPAIVESEHSDVPRSGSTVAHRRSVNLPIGKAGARQPHLAYLTHLTRLTFSTCSSHSTNRTASSRNLVPTALPIERSPNSVFPKTCIQLVGSMPIPKGFCCSAMNLN